MSASPRCALFSALLRDPGVLSDPRPGEVRSASSAWSSAPMRRPSGPSPRRPGHRDRQLFRDRILLYLGPAASAVLGATQRLARTSTSACRRPSAGRYSPWSWWLSRFFASKKYRWRWTSPPRSYVMLGIGLNIVVGLAGLLDLGYVGFRHGCLWSGAATSTPASAWTALPMAGMMAAAVRGDPRFPGVAPARRLPGDRHPRLRRDHPHPAAQHDRDHRRPQRHRLDPRRPAPRPDLRTPAPEGMQTFHEFFGIAYNTNYKVILFIYVVVPGGAAGPVRDQPADACRSVAPGRRCAGRSRPSALGLNHDHRQTLRLHHRRQLRRFLPAASSPAQGFVTPESSFTFIESAMILAIVVLGGMGSQLGVILAAVVMVLLREMRGFNRISAMLISAYHGGDDDLVPGDPHQPGATPAPGAEARADRSSASSGLMMRRRHAGAQRRQPDVERRWSPMIGP